MAKKQPKNKGVRIDLPPVPVIPKSIMKTAREIAATPPEHLIGTPDGTLTIRADQLTEDDIKQFVVVFLAGDDDEREKMLRFLLSAMKGLTEHRQWLADQLITFGEIMEQFYQKIGLPQPD